jgi:hypothetical protein
MENEGTKVRQRWWGGKIGEKRNVQCGVNEMIGSVASQTPPPAAFFLYATGIGVMGLLGFRKRRHRAGAVVA